MYSPYGSSAYEDFGEGMGSLGSQWNIGSTQQAPLGSAGTTGSLYTGAANSLASMYPDSKSTFSPTGATSAGLMNQTMQGTSPLQPTAGSTSPWDRLAFNYGIANNNPANAGAYTTWWDGEAQDLRTDAQKATPDVGWDAIRSNFTGDQAADPALGTGKFSSFKYNPETGNYTIRRQRTDTEGGNNKYDLYDTDYRVSEDGKYLEMIGGPKEYYQESGWKEHGQDALKFIATAVGGYMLLPALAAGLGATGAGLGAPTLEATFGAGGNLVGAAEAAGGLGGLGGGMGGLSAAELEAAGAADMAGGLVPEFGTEAAYNAGIAGHSIPAGLQSAGLDPGIMNGTSPMPSYPSPATTNPVPPGNVQTTNLPPGSPGGGSPLPTTGNPLADSLIKQLGTAGVKQLISGGLGGGSGAGAGGSGGGFDLNALLNTGGNLAGIWSANQAYDDVRDLQKELTGMYGPESPYAAQLRQQLDRRDAAAGRRSQYGPREVELQSNLAQQTSKNMLALAGLYKDAAGYRNQMVNNGLQGLSGLFGGGTSGGGASIPSWLQDLFKNNQGGLDFNGGLTNDNIAPPTDDNWLDWFNNAEMGD